MVNLGVPNRTFHGKWWTFQGLFSGELGCRVVSPEVHKEFSASQKKLEVRILHFELGVSREFHICIFCHPGSSCRNMKEWSWSSGGTNKEIDLYEIFRAHRGWAQRIGVSRNTQMESSEQLSSCHLIERTGGRWISCLCSCSSSYHVFSDSVVSIWKCDQTSHRRDSSISNLLASSTQSMSRSHIQWSGENEEDVFFFRETNLPIGHHDVFVSQRCPSSSRGCRNLLNRVCSSRLVRCHSRIRLLVDLEWLDFEKP